MPWLWIGRPVCSEGRGLMCAWSAMHAQGWRAPMKRRVGQARTAAPGMTWTATARGGTAATMQRPTAQTRRGHLHSSRWGACSCACFLHSQPSLVHVSELLDESEHSKEDLRQEQHSPVCESSAVRVPCRARRAPGGSRSGPGRRPSAAVLMWQGLAWRMRALRQAPCRR